MHFMNNRIGMAALLLAFLAPAAPAAERRGALCLTFDDFGGDHWVKADKIFKKYVTDAFVYGIIETSNIGRQ